MRPVSHEEAMSINMRDKDLPVWTICEVLRKLYWVADTIHNEEIKLMAREASVLAKRMNKKLREYKSNYDKGWWTKK